ncbi:nucleotidyltransferase family protein (plasmid) [Halorussus salilacus]|uniref:nucleotidyltransferase family protein n=1 Tax=Halorussus salilacus TaxID=2953750 RepID=UPI00209C9C33|nr:nucleotidyltransferase family protein [Halorussus salilacus]USZ69913.1 nucleotidyltransferase family protein [Halorussus salilacus]
MILGVVLAAGSASRFEGSNKLLASLDGDPVVAHATRTLAESSVDALVAVVGHDAERVVAALPPAVEVLENPDHGAGQSTSVRRGVEAARQRDAAAVLFALGDMPRVSVETVERLLSAYRDRGPEGETIAAPRYDGRRGNPVLFGAEYFDALAGVEGDRGGRVLLETEPVAWVDVADPGIHRDVDTLGDLRDLQDESASSDADSSSGEDADSGLG